MRFALLALSLICAVPASAAELTMVCTNPRQDYLVTLDTAERSLVLNGTTRYMVTAIEQSDGRTIAAGMVGQDSSLGFAAQFAPDMKIEFFADQEIVQTDMCRNG